MGGLNWGFFFQAQTDTPAKLAAFAYAYVHLKIAGYELLKRTALRAGTGRRRSSAKNCSRRSGRWPRP